MHSTKWVSPGLQAAFVQPSWLLQHYVHVPSAMHTTLRIDYIKDTLKGSSLGAALPYWLPTSMSEQCMEGAAALSVKFSTLTSTDYMPKLLTQDRKRKDGNCPGFLLVLPVSACAALQRVLAPVVARGSARRGGGGGGFFSDAALQTRHVI